MIGVWTVNRAIVDIYVMLFFGVVGYLMMRYGYPVAAASICIILGRGFEAYLRRGLLLSNKSLWTFVTRPYTALILSFAIALLVYGAIGTIKLARKAKELKEDAIAEHLTNEPA
jgi:putative tricarboxylic transport membrane protein